MLVYIIPTIFCLLCIYLYDYKKEKIGRRECFFTLALYLAVISGLSYKIGGDSRFYMESFDEIPSLYALKIIDFSESPYQPLYLILCAACKTITPKMWLMHLVQSLIVCFAYFKFIKRNTLYIFTGAFMFMTCIYTYFCYEIFKESLAISMVLIGYKYLNEKKYLKYYFYAFLSLMFHFSGIIAFLFPFLIHLKFNKVFFIWISVLILILVSFETYLTFLIENGDLIPSELLIQKLGYYVIVATDKYNENWFLMALIRNVLVPIGAVITIKILQKTLPFEWAYVIYILLGIGTLQLALIFERPMNYFLPFVVLSLSEIMGTMYRKGFSKFFITFTTCFIFWFACRGWFYSREEVWRIMIPYESIIDEKEDRERENVVMKLH